MFFIDEKSSGFKQLFINDGLSQEEQLLKLNKIAIHQMKLPTEDNRINQLVEKETASGRE